MNDLQHTCPLWLQSVTTISHVYVTFQVMAISQKQVVLCTKIAVSGVNVRVLDEMLQKVHMGRYFHDNANQQMT